MKPPTAKEWTPEFREALVGKVFYLGRKRVTIRRAYSDIIGGVVLDVPVNGFISWNLSDLTKRPSNNQP